MTGSGACLRRLASALLSRAVRVMPSARRSWADAMERELRYIENDFAAVAWAFGCLKASCLERVKAMTVHQRINRIGAVVPAIMSFLAFAVVLAVVTTGWERHLNDEGAAAHIFQLLIVGQIPLIMGFLATANWRRLTQVVRPMVFQAVALTLALGSVAFFKL